MKKFCAARERSLGLHGMHGMQACCMMHEGFEKLILHASTVACFGARPFPPPPLRALQRNSKE